jgi:phosphoribosylanthranilate isomerase
MKSLRVLIVDDVPQVRRELRTLLPLLDDIDIVGEAENVWAGLLRDAPTAGHGGSGRPCHWPTARALAGRGPVVLAGGLTPGNVAEAIAAVGPYGVDVASGVERSPGVKDHELLERFIRAAKESP